MLRSTKLNLEKFHRGDTVLHRIDNPAMRESSCITLKNQSSYIESKVYDRSFKSQLDEI